MPIIDDLFKTLPDGKVIDVLIGLHWSAVIVEIQKQKYCGLAATLKATHGHAGKPDIPEAGQLTLISALDMARLIYSDHPTQMSLGMATLNALIPKRPESWIECNASEKIVELGAGKHVVLIGHFSFVNDIKNKVGRLSVLEQDPQYGDLPAELAPEILPQADVIAITGMTFINHSLESILNLCPLHAHVMVLGPSTPLSPILFQYGIGLISGAVVTQIEPVCKALIQGANFHQIRKAGAQLVTIIKPNSNPHSVVGKEKDVESYT